MANINKLFNGRNHTIKFLDDYISMILEAKRKAAEEELKPEPAKAKTKRKESPFELHKKSVNEIKNDEKNVNEEIFRGYFFNHTPFFFRKRII